MQNAFAACLAAALLLAARTASAQATYDSAPIGGRSALMGGTGVALGRDGAAPFLNPATVAAIDDSGTFSMNVYSYQSSQLNGFHQPGPVDGGPLAGLSLPNASLSSSRVDALPSTFCVFLTVGGPADDDKEARVHPKGRQKGSLCVTSPERLQLGATADAYTGGAGPYSVTQTTSFAQFWNRLYVGPSYGIYVTDRLALGASILGAGTVANSTWSVDSLVTGPGGGFASSYATGASAWSMDVTALLGLTWRIDDRQVLGVGIMTPSVHVIGKYQGTTGLQTQDGGSVATTTTSKGSYRATTPLRIGAGLGANLTNLHVEADLTAYVPVTDLAHAEIQTTKTTLAAGAATTTAAAQTLSVAGKPVVDAAVGGELFLSKGFSLVGGLNTDFSAIAPLAQSPPIGTLAEARTHHAGLSIGFGSYGEGSEMLLGTQLTYGWGKNVAVDPYDSPAQLALVDQRTFGAMLVIAGSVSLTAFRRTLQNLETVVKIPR
ncbi:MAG TPA: hypothetical protein VGG39_07540 [Polyangiaceae bacterium]|jgi:hypothetical protein